MKIAYLLSPQPSTKVSCPWILMQIAKHGLITFQSMIQVRNYKKRAEQEYELWGITERIWEINCFQRKEKIGEHQLKHLTDSETSPNYSTSHKWEVIKCSGNKISHKHTFV